MRSIFENKNKTCKLCNRKFDYSYSLFGKLCLDHEYKLLGISKPKKVKNKEMFLCNQIAKKLHLTNLNKDEKYVLTEKYLTIQYLDKIKYGNLDEQKKKILDEINGIKSITSDSIISLSKAYRLYKTTIKFNQKLKELDKELNDYNLNIIKEKKSLESMKFIFDINRISNPIEYQVYYCMQYVFWKVVVAGGYLKKMKLSAKLLQNSLSLFGQTPKNIIILEENTKKKIKENEVFKQKIKNIIEKYGQGKNSFVVNKNNYIDIEDINVEFNDDYDLYLSIHGATLDMAAKKNKDNIWDMDIKMTDTYDFTDWKNKRETYDKIENSITNSEKIKALGNILNNFGVISMKYGVLKEFQVSIEFKINSNEL